MSTTMYDKLSPIFSAYADKINQNASDITELNSSLGALTVTNFTASMQESLKKIGVSDIPVEESDLYACDSASGAFSAYDFTSAGLTVDGGKIGRSGGSNTHVAFFADGVKEFEWDFTTSKHDIICPIVSAPYYSSTYGCYAVKAFTMRYNLLGSRGTVRLDTGAFQDDRAINWVPDSNFAKVHVKLTDTSVIFTFTHVDNTVTTREYTYGTIGASAYIPSRTGFRAYAQFSATGDSIFTSSMIYSTESIYTTKSADSVLSGKTWDAWGDSFTAGSGTYVDIIANASGCTAMNGGHSGFGYKRGGNGALVADITTYYGSNSAGDYITIFAGVNDFLYDIPLTDFETAVSNAITAVISAGSLAKFGVIIPPATAILATNTLGLTIDDYAEKIIEQCKANSVPYLDLLHAANWYTTEAFCNAYYGGVSNLHPNSSGQTLLAEKIRKFMENL